MYLLEKIINLLLTESASESEVVDAIERHQKVIINYKSPSNSKDTANGEREIEVYAYGDSKAGNPVIRAFQPQGDTMSKVPSWKFFRLDGIKSWQPTGETFDTPAEQRFPGYGDFNPETDKTMSIVKKIARFDYNTINSQPDTGPKTKYDVAVDTTEIDNNPDQKTIDAFGKDNYTPTQTISGPKKKTDLFKTDTERGMERLRQQLQNPRKIDLSQFDKKKPQEKPLTLADISRELKKEPEVYKTDTEKRLERLKQQLANPRKIDLSQPPKQAQQNVEPNKVDNKPQEKPLTLADVSREMKNEPDTYKTDTEKRLERLKQQLENPRKIDLSQIPKK